MHEINWLLRPGGANSWIQAIIGETTYRNPLVLIDLD